eukprot:TRINITY_DN49311_c0_g1_i1.p1 TRINITY_DN49311_c0_g1~~TRINITY_DN49311_c0_g1_i1.p1  ORF type:complete len:272 (-),score=40.50 TRINITY_DN49311_c0_g1_i1:190-1005(-)
MLAVPTLLKSGCAAVGHGCAPRIGQQLGCVLAARNATFRASAQRLASRTCTVRHPTLKSVTTRGIGGGSSVGMVSLAPTASRLSPLTPGQLARDRGIATISDTAQLDQTIPFGELLTYLDTQYGIAAQYVEETLTDLAHILGYMKVATDTMIEYGDASILLEEVGAPPVTSEEILNFHESIFTSGAEETEETAEMVETSLDDPRLDDFVHEVLARSSLVDADDEIDEVAIDQAGATKHGAARERTRIKLAVIKKDPFAQVQVSLEPRLFRR